MKNFIPHILVLAFMVILLIINPPTDDHSARKALMDSGYHPIKVGGYGWFACSGGDYYQTKFKAYSPDSSRVVHGCVCEGLILKGKTIRLD